MLLATHTAAGAGSACSAGNAGTGGSLCNGGVKRRKYSEQLEWVKSSQPICLSAAPLHRAGVLGRPNCLPASQGFSGWHLDATAGFQLTGSMCVQGWCIGCVSSDG